jgi:hypothetical protein
MYVILTRCPVMPDPDLFERIRTIFLQERSFVSIR